MLLAPVVGVVGLGLLLHATPPRRALPDKTGPALVTGIYPNATSGFRTPTVAIVATTADQLRGQVNVDFTDARCHIGDTIDGTWTGAVFVPDPRSCRRPPPVPAGDDEPSRT